MATGKVKWFNDARGFGFIQTEDDAIGQREIFVHFSEVTTGGYKTLLSGQQVAFRTS